MTIKIEKEPSSVYTNDIDYEWQDILGAIHLTFRCRHDCISYDLDIDNMWCPECDNEDLTEREREQYLDAYDRDINELEY